jgi:hypothetical protein
MTAADFERLDELQAEVWIARRFWEFANAGFPPALALGLAVHPDIAVPLMEPAGSGE